MGFSCDSSIFLNILTSNILTTSWNKNQGTCTVFNTWNVWNIGCTWIPLSAFNSDRALPLMLLFSYNCVATSSETFCFKDFWFLWNRLVYEWTHFCLCFGFQSHRRGLRHVSTFQIIVWSSVCLHYWLRQRQGLFVKAVLLRFRCQRLLIWLTCDFGHLKKIISMQRLNLPFCLVI